MKASTLFKDLTIDKLQTTSLSMLHEYDKKDASSTLTLQPMELHSYKVRLRWASASPRGSIMLGKPPHNRYWSICTCSTWPKDNCCFTRRFVRQLFAFVNFEGFLSSSVLEGIGQLEGSDDAFLLINLYLDNWRSGWKGMTNNWHAHHWCEGACHSTMFPALKFRIIDPQIVRPQAQSNGTYTYWYSI